MGKTFRFIPVILLTLVFLATRPEFVYAVNQNDFEVIQSPNPFSIDDRDISITVQTKDSSDYFTENKYSFAAWKGELNRDADCTQTNFQGVASRELTWNSKQATAKFQIFRASCGFLGDQWRFRLWRGTGWDAMVNTDNIIKDYSFIITQSGGQVITISAKNPVVYSGEKPTVILSNIAPNNDYTFWWRDEWKDIAGYYSRDKNPDNPVEVIIPYFDVNKSSRRLCMEYGNHRFPPGGNNSCNTPGKYADFNFKNEKRPGPSGYIKCSILPSTSLPLNSNVNIKIENLPSGTRIFAYATNNDTEEQWSTVFGTSDSTYVVTLTIVNRGSAGSYSATAYTDIDPNTNICFSLPNPAFTISSNPVSAPSASPCTGDKCTSAGGEPCKTGDNRGPAFVTAIGCVHTNPAEFVKDFMTWVLGIGGGLAFLMMLMGAFQMLTSAGNPETLNAGKDRLTSAIIGLLMVIFAILLLQIIGVGILKIPGFK